MMEVSNTHSMKASVRIGRGVESLFGTRDENIRLIESGLSVHTQLVDNNLEIEGEAPQRVARAETFWRITTRWCAKATSSTTAT